MGKKKRSLSTEDERAEGKNAGGKIKKQKVIQEKEARKNLKVNFISFNQMHPVIALIF